jgi:type VI secretion system secreted protein VgrG
MSRLDDGYMPFASTSTLTHAYGNYLRDRWKQNLLMQDFVVPFKQTNRPFRINTPLGKDKLLLYQFRAHEQLGRLFEYQAELMSEDDAIPLDTLLGQRVDVELDLVDGGQRYFNAFVSRFTQIGIVGDLFHYQAILHPWPWFLTLTKDCRIYQKQTVPEILLEIFSENGFSDYELHLTNDYRTREYSVQFNETDFDFISRLMEEEGIYYYFDHSADKHTLVLCDNYASHSPLQGNPVLPFQPIPGIGGRRGKEVVHSWKISKAVKSGCYGHTDYDFEKPRAELLASTPLARNHSYANHEVSDYPGNYVNIAEAEQFSRSRIEESQAKHEQIEGECDIRHLSSGGLFTLKDHPRADQNREYLISEVSYSLQADRYRAGKQSTENEGCHCEFTCIPSNEVFRTRRVTPKPRVEGPQSAVVVGPAGEEIHTDKYGRVKVQFHWDHYGKSHENSSCWVRATQTWAGKNLGGIQIPRIGQEVLVEFLDGDLDRPIITDRVYNAEQMPPWGLPLNQTQSGILSRSSKGGTAANAIRFEDKMGEEQLWLHAQKDQLTEVEHDEDKWVGNDRRKTIDGNETTTVHKNRTETVVLNETIGIGGNRNVTINGNKIETVSIGKAETIGAAKALSLSAAYQVSVGAAMNTTVAAEQWEEVGHSKDVKVGKDFKIQVGTDCVLTASDSITLQVGKSSFYMDKEGNIQISGETVTVVGNKEINLNP